MQNQTLPVDVCELLDACIDSIEALDALLLLLRDPGRWWSLPELACTMGAEPDSAGAAVASLRARGLAEGRAGALVRLARLDAFALAAFLALASACAAHRAAAMEHVSRRTMARYRVLADAFTRARAT